MKKPSKLPLTGDRLDDLQARASALTSLSALVCDALSLEKPDIALSYISQTHPALQVLAYDLEDALGALEYPKG